MFKSNFCSVKSRSVFGTAKAFPGAARAARRISKQAESARERSLHFGENSLCMLLTPVTYKFIDRQSRLSDNSSQCASIQLLMVRDDEITGSPLILRPPSPQNVLPVPTDDLLPRHECNRRWPLLCSGWLLL